MNEYELLMGLDLSDEEKLRMMAESLRGKQQAADFFALSSIPEISESANARRDQLYETATRGGILKNALADRESREQEGALNRANMLQRALAGGRSRGGKQYSYVQSMLGPDGQPVLMGLNADTGEMEPVAGSEGYKPDPLTSSQMGGLLERADKRLAPTLELTQSVEQLDNLLENHAGGDPRSVPGLTFAEKAPGIGGVFRLTRDVWTGKGEAGLIYSAVRGVINTIIRNQAGLTQTNRELANVREQTGMDALSDPQVFLENLDRIKDALEIDLQRIRNTMAPEVVDQIESEFGATGQQSPFNHKFRRHQWEQPKGGVDSVWDALSRPMMPEQQGPKPIEEMTDEEILRELQGG